MMKQSIIYERTSGVCPYREYLHSVKDRQGAAKIRTRVTRAETGNFGDHRSVGEGVIELRIDFGPGYRVYVAPYGEQITVVLCAGDKSTQQNDIVKAHEYWADLKRTL